MIIGLKGAKGSGKDTVAAYLIKEHGFSRRAFADPLKRSVAALLNIPYSEIDKWKDDPRIFVSVVRQYETDGPETMYTQTFREFLQREGDEATMGVFGENFWLDYTLPLDGYYSGKNIVVTDARFESNARRIRACGGFVVQIRRPGFEDPNDTHRGEKPFPLSMVDYSLINNKELDGLYRDVEEMLDELAGRKLNEQTG